MPGFAAVVAVRPLFIHYAFVCRLLRPCPLLLLLSCRARTPTISLRHYDIVHCMAITPLSAIIIVPLSVRYYAMSVHYVLPTAFVHYYAITIGPPYLRYDIIGWLKVHY